jgi:hypothetical protein
VQTALDFGFKSIFCFGSEETYFEEKRFGHLFAITFFPMFSLTVLCPKNKFFRIVQQEFGASIIHPDFTFYAFCHNISVETDLKNPDFLFFEYVSKNIGIEASSLFENTKITYKNQKCFMVFKNFDTENDAQNIFFKKFELLSSHENSMKSEKVTYPYLTDSQYAIEI